MLQKCMSSADVWKYQTQFCLHEDFSRFDIQRLPMKEAGSTDGWDMFLKTQIRWHNNSWDAYVSTGLDDVTIACYDKQHVFAYLQPFLRYEPTAVK